MPIIYFIAGFMQVYFVVVVVVVVVVVAVLVVFVVAAAFVESMNFRHCVTERANSAHACQL